MAVTSDQRVNGERALDIVPPLRGVHETPARIEQPELTTFGKVDDAVAGSVFYGMLNCFPFDKFLIERLSSRPGVTALFTAPTVASVGTASSGTDETTSGSGTESSSASSGSSLTSGSSSGS